jgi:hypothetical protein
LAKQFGVDDEALAGLQDPERFPFPPDQRAALRFADAMTGDSRAVPDELFDDLRRHFSEPQIVEIATVIGLFNYFNRFNNALHVEITLTDPDVLLHRVKEAVAALHDPQALCERVAEILALGRRYLRVGVYQQHDRDSKVRLAATRSELIVPIRAGAAIAGVIDVESDREAAFGVEDRSLVEAVAEILAPALDTAPPAR